MRNPTLNRWWLALLAAVTLTLVSGCVDLEDADPADPERIADADEDDRNGTSITPPPDPDGPENGRVTADPDNEHLERGPQPWIREN